MRADRLGCLGQPDCQRMGFRRLTPSLKSNSAAAWAGRQKIAVAQAAEAAPSRPRRVNSLFSLLFFSRALIAPGNSFRRSAASASRARIRRQKIWPKTPNSDETILRNPRNHPETGRAYLFSQQRAVLAPREAHMNHSIHSADRTTHLKIVVVALVAGIAVAAFGISARSGSDFTPDRSCHEGGQAGGCHQLGSVDGPLNDNDFIGMKTAAPTGGLFVCVCAERFTRTNTRPACLRCAADERPSA